MKILKRLAIVFLIIIHFAIFTSQSQYKKYKEIDPGYNTLKNDPVFANAYQYGKAKYQELLQVIQENAFFDDGERVVCRQESLTYIFYKKQQIIESTGFGDRILVHSIGRIDKIDH